MIDRSPDPDGLGLDELDWMKTGGLLPAAVVDADTAELLMLAHVTRDTLAETVRTGEVVFWSRSRSARWRKGETTGNVLDLVAWSADCDRDAIRLEVRPRGPVCHTGARTCFDDGPRAGGAFLLDLDRIVADRADSDPDASYTARLLGAGPARRAQKVGEEGVETALAGVTGDDDALLDEAADLVYHLAVLLRGRGLDLAAVGRTLARRHRP